MNYRLIRIYEPTTAFLEAFSKNIREADKRELEALNTSIIDEIKDSITCSDECYAALTDDGEPIVVYGRTFVENRPGCLIWCLGTNKLKDYWRPFARESRKQLQYWAEKYGPLFNAVGAFNTEAIRWLDWCGATFGPDFIRGDELFRYFVICEGE